MAQRIKLSRADVEERYTDEQQQKLVSLYHLSTVLENAIIAADYKPTDELRNAIGLSPYGSWLLQQGKKFAFEAREGRLACLLELYHLDILVDLETTDEHAIAAAISKEIRSGRLRFPMIFGPDLYNRAADLFPDEKRSLNAADTQRLLEGQPEGVFHLGKWLVGPWGVYAHQVSRSIAPSHSIPLQHCHDVSCAAVHTIWLSSDTSAEIIKARPEIRKALESEGEEPSDFAPVMAEVLKDPEARYNSDSLGAIGFLIGDALGVTEMRVLVEHLLDGRHAADMRSKLDKLASLSGAAQEITAELNRSQLLQIALLATDKQIARALDDLVFGQAGSRTIHVPAHEVRKSVLTKATSSKFGSRPEYSRLGVRTSSVSAAAPLKLRRLVDAIYFPSVPSPERLRELEWQLRALPGVSIEASLTEFLRKTPPEVVLQRLVLNTRENVERASSTLALEVAAQDVSDTELVDRMLWKLGFEVAESDRLHEDFWRHSDRLRKAAEAAGVSTSVGEEEISEISASYFRALEKLLADTLVYCVWTLTTDHIREDIPFIYVENSAALESATNKLGPGLAARGDIPDAKVGVEKWTLHPLCRGFEVLSDTLAGMESREADFTRPPESVPDFENRTTIQRFPFKHLVPFLDLTRSSRERIHASLKDATKSLLGSRAAEIRNGLLHYRRSNVDLEQLVEALEAVESVVRILEAQGLIRIIYRRQRVEVDRWGRSLHTLVDSAGSERAISRPSAYAWVNFPSLDRPQYLMTVAQFDQLGEYLRFRPGSESEFRSMWAGVPRRRLESVAGRSQQDQERTAGGA